ISAGLSSGGAAVAPRRAAEHAIPASDRRRWLGGNVCDGTEPAARRSTGWWAHSVFGVSKIAQVDFAGGGACAAPTGEILLDRLGALGCRTVADQPASIDSESSRAFHGAKMVCRSCDCNVGIGVHPHAAHWCFGKGEVAGHPRLPTRRGHARCALPPRRGAPPATSKVTAASSRSTDQERLHLRRFANDYRPERPTTNDQRSTTNDRSYISHTASTSTITCVRGIFRAAASASIDRNSVFIFSRLGDFRMK